MTKSPLSVTKFRLVFISWWITWAILQMLLLYWLGFTLSVSCIDALVSNILLAATCMLVSNNLKYYLPQKERYWYILVLSFIMGALWLAACKWILGQLIKGPSEYALFLTRSLPIRFGVSFLLIACMAMISVLWYTFEEQEENERRQTEAEKLTREAELYKLRRQLQPHFLFNSLNSISALIGSKPEEARTMIHQLSEFLRSTLKKDEQQWVTLNEEMQYLELYLAIEKVRFGHRLNTVIETDELSGQMKLPNMLLQPIVENAIKFSIYDTPFHQKRSSSL